jgi:hypothetical protein
VTKLGQALLDVGALTPASLSRALDIQKTSGGRLGTVLVEQGLVSEQTLARALAKVTGREYAHWEIVKATPKEILALLPPKIALRALAIPFSRQGRVLKVAMLDPNDLATEDELGFVTGRKIEPCVMAEFRVAEALERFYGKQRMARFRLLSEKIDRGLTRAADSSPRPSPPPPPPPQIFGGSEPPPPSAATPPGGRAGGGPSDVWKTESQANGEEIEISSWKPAPRSRPTPLPAAAPAAASLELEYTPEEVEAAPGSKPMSIDEAAAKIRRAESRNEIADAALACLEGSYGLVALFIARKEDAIGWKVRGEGVSKSAFQSLRIPFSEPSLFLNVRISTAFYQGLFPSLPAHEPLVAALGRRPERCALFPVVLKKRVVAFLMVEPGETALPPGQVTALHKLAGAMAEGFAALILSQREHGKPA